MSDQLTELVITVEGMEPIELACPLDSPVLRDLCVCWANQDEYGDRVMSLKIGADNPQHVTFPVAAMRGLDSSLPLPEELFLVTAEAEAEAYAHLDFEAGWIDWVRENRERGAPREKVYRVMLDKGVHPRAIRELLDYEPETPLGITERPDRESILPLLATEIDPKYRVQCDYLELYSIPGFIDVAGCALFNQLIDEHGAGERSTLYADNPVSEVRTSEAFVFANAEKVHPRIREFQLMLCELLNSSLEFAEPFTGVVYKPAQQFRAHRDYFNDGQGLQYESSDGTQRRGQRQWTVLVYLNDAEPGTGTRFHRIRQEFTPGAGTALVWNNLYPSGRPNHYSHHAGLPVSKGEKRLITQLFRR